jgi:acid phosphatase family membrane protein YuiD
MGPEGTAYVLAPFAGWVAAGTLKFVVNSARARRWAWGQMGYGGFPSTHVTVVVATAALIGMRAGWLTPGFSVALAVGWLVALDAVGLRRQLGHHASLLNAQSGEGAAKQQLRERMGHGWVDVLGGALVGVVCAVGLDLLLP